MEVLYTTLHILAIVCLLIVTGMEPYRTTISRFELERRVKNGDNKAKKLLQREEKLADVFSLQKVTAAVLLVLISFLGVLAYQWLFGLGVALILALEVGVIAKWSFIKKNSKKIYDKIEPAVLRFIKKYPVFFRFIAATPVPVEEKYISSKEELMYLANQSSNVLSDEEKKIIESSLGFAGKTVEEIMIPRGMIDSVEKSEVLGPLVLHDLHKTGHSRFPVVDKDIDHIVGMLHVQDLLSLKSEDSSSKVSQKMDKKVHYIREDQNLQDALNAFIKTRHHLFVVINELRETVGLLSLEDTIEALIGREIIDEFDTHHDIRLVAKRNIRANNTPKNSVDV